MTRRSLRSTTALILSLALAAPLPLAAQDTAVEECPEGADPETCLPAAEAEEGTVTEEVEEALPQVTDTETDGATEQETTEAPGGEEVDPSSTVEAEESVEETAPAETAETPPTPDAEVIEAPETAEETETEPEAPETEVTETEDQPAETEEAPAEVETVEEAPAEEQTDPATAEVPATTETEESGADVATETEAPAEQGDTAIAEEPAEGATEQPDAEVATETETPAEDDGIAIIESPAEGETEQPEAEVATETETTAEDGDTAAIEEEAETEQAEAPETEVTQEDTDTSTAAANETPEAAATAAVEGEADTEAEVVTETVTEETSRSSDEEFTTSASRSADEDDDDEGLSALETFALGAAGLVVLDQIIGRNEQVVTNSGDRVVVQRDDGNFYVLKDDNALLRQPGAQISTQTFDDGSTLQRVTREDGSEVVTIRAANGQVLRRSRILPDGTEVLLFDDTVEAAPVEVTELPEPQQRSISLDTATEDELRAALRQRELEALDRSFTLQQIRQIRAVRELVPVIELDAVTFDTGSAAIRASQADALIAIGEAMRDVIEENPNEVFLVEGHTDAVGSASLNLALSDRRAESVALALTEYFDVPPENLVVQGYGEANLKVVTEEANRENRRATVRRITPLLARLN